MGQAFDSGDHFLGEVRGKDFQDVFDKLKSEFKQADKFVIGKGDPPAPTTEMPRYRCHKEVWALKIAAIDVNHAGADTDGSSTITPADLGYAPFRVDRDYVLKHNPHAGGYYVVYKDGYKSFSPAEAFEDGYTRL